MQADRSFLLRREKTRNSYNSFFLFPKFLKIFSFQIKDKTLKVYPKCFYLEFKANYKLFSYYLHCSLQGGCQPIIWPYQCDTFLVLLLVNRGCRYPPGNWSGANSGDRPQLLQVSIVIVTLLNLLLLNATIHLEPFYYVLGTRLILKY